MRGRVKDQLQDKTNRTISNLLLDFNKMIQWAI